MTRKERLMATLRGELVDRPAVNFYEIGGFKIDPCDPDPYNIYNSPDWQPLLKLAEEQTDIIRLMQPVGSQAINASGEELDPAYSEFFSVRTMKNYETMIRLCIY